jgi:hypothetical protein
MPSWRLFTINDRFISWNSDGVIARLVYIAFKLPAFHWRVIRAEDAAAARAAQGSVVAQTRLWLEAHNFPRLLSESFSDP